MRGVPNPHSPQPTFTCHPSSPTAHLHPWPGCILGTQNATRAEGRLRGPRSMGLQAQGRLQGVKLESPGCPGAHPTGRETHKGTQSWGVDTTNRGCGLGPPWSHKWSGTRSESCRWGRPVGWRVQTPKLHTCTDPRSGQRGGQARPDPANTPGFEPQQAQAQGGTRTPDSEGGVVSSVWPTHPPTWGGGAGDTRAKTRLQHTHSCVHARPQALEQI